ncbi:MAG: phosphoribosylamine--glycine ligase [Actinomycetia bacterium]|nr:phosphoribosylamine--glycine ligase [Actinomycetes bacterium]
MARVLVVGSGGREHTLAWGLARSPEVSEVISAPGNPGMAEIGECRPVDVEDPNAIAALAGAVDADLTVVGAEVPLVAGAVDALEARGRLAFGPRADAAHLEGSKAWMKEVVAAAGVPTARHRAFGAGEHDAAFAFLDSLGAPYVVKTDGLAAGKGVAVVASLDEARDAVRAYLSGDAFGAAGRTLVIEEGLVGPELSLLVLCDGRDAIPLQPAQDFKRIGDGDTGPNTGGMGAYSPVPIATREVVDEVMAKAVRPTLDELRRRGIEYRGVLYAGLMLTNEGPKIIEYNVRFGDPECQVVVPRLASDLYRHCVESAAGRFETEVRFLDDAAITVVLAAEGYPSSPRTGDVIEGLDDAEAREGIVVFHAGTKRDGDRLLTAGGRVLAVTATAPDLATARTRAYDAVAGISWPGMQYRRDIALAAVADQP